MSSLISELTNTMTIHRKLLIAVLFAASVLIPVATSNAQGISIAIGDRPYYHGASYWHNGARVYWVPGYWGPHHRWVSGHYARRGYRWHNGHRIYVGY
jgi:hypothetical protein